MALLPGTADLGHPALIAGSSHGERGHLVRGPRVALAGVFGVVEIDKI